MAFVVRPTSIRNRIVLLLSVALLVFGLAACNSDEPSDEATGETAETDDGTPTATPEDDGSEDQGDSEDGEPEPDDGPTPIEGATSQQQERIDSGKPTLLIRAPEPGAQVESPMQMRFEVLNGEIVQNSSDEDGYVIFVTVGKSSSLIPIYDDEGEIRLTKNGSTRVTAMLGGKRGPIRKTAVGIKVTATGLPKQSKNPSGGSSSSGD